MDVRVLGPLEIRTGEAALPLGTPKQRTVLALLLARAGQFVSVDELVDEVWQAEPPASAGANVRMYAANLRRLFAARRTGLELVRRGTGYVLGLGERTLDATAFTQLVRQAREALARGAAQPALDGFGRADALWRGRALEDVPLGWRLSAWRTSLEEQRIAAVEAQAEAYLVLDRGAEAVAALRAHLATQPIREPAYLLLMRALYQAGDVTGALDAFIEARKALAEHLGIEPGAPLQRLQQAILNRDPVLLAAPARAPDRPVPRELPPDVAVFTGRRGELAAVRAALRETGRDRAALVVVHGRGGAGKSALAVRAAHAASTDFPDGQLYIDLHGSTPAVRPRSAYEVLDRCLRALGVPAAEVPADESDAAATWRTLTAGRRLLVVLDNVTEPGQVAPVLPASGSCATIVTSRRALATLDADRYVELGGLPAREGAALLARAARRPVEEDAVAELVGLCEHLPLALRVAGARLGTVPAADLAARLRDEHRRLDELGVDGYAVRSCIRVGYDGLGDSADPVDRAAYAVFPLLGLLPVPRLHPVTVAALTGVADPARALARLVEVRLLEEAPAGGYRLHDLVRLVAGECAGQVLSGPERDAAVRRALDHYLATALAADAVLRPGRRALGGLGYAPDPAVPAVPVGTAAEALAWLDAELPTLLAAAEYAVGLPGDAPLLALRLGRVLQWSLGKRADWPTELALARLAERGATRAGDARQRALAVTLVGRALLHLGRRDEAATRLAEALDGFRRLDDLRQVTALLVDLGLVARLGGDHPTALERYAEALFLCRGSGGGVPEAIVLTNLADVYIEMRNWEDARGCLEESLAIRRAHGDSAGETVVLPSLGYLCCQLGRLDEAIGHLDAAVTRCTAIGNAVDRWYSLIVRSETHLRLGRYRPALADARRALTSCPEDGWEYERATSLRQVAKTLLALRRTGSAAGYSELAARAFAGYAGRRDPALEILLAGPE
jgi:DNA-binding SARP family transcriptional activator